MTDDDMKKFLATVLENYRFTTGLDLEILGRVAANLSLAESESILTRAREAEADPGRMNIPAFRARAIALIDHRNIKPSTPRRLIDFVRSELGREACDANGEALDAMSCITKYYSRCWQDMKRTTAESSWRERFRRIMRRQARVALMEMDWEEADADAVAAQIVEMPVEEAKATPIAHLQL